MWSMIRCLRLTSGWKLHGCEEDLHHFHLAACYMRYDIANYFVIIFNLFYFAPLYGLSCDFACSWSCFWEKLVCWTGLWFFPHLLCDGGSTKYITITLLYKLHRHLILMNSLINVKFYYGNVWLPFVYIFAGSLFDDICVVLFRNASWCMQIVWLQI